MMKKLLAVVSAAMLSGIILVGCGQGPDEKMTIEQVEADAAKLDAKQLQAKINSYKPVIDAKKVELAKILARLKKVPPDKLLSNDPEKEIKADFVRSSKLGNSISKLTLDMNIYTHELSKKATTK